ncbi:LytTR family DNA-binding domain-containing protein [Microbacterium sp. W1N]|uniref:LytR/AlgR family response regulator transcription factor n=1 Tax=Microbacterium festucae TaxID=2977531 RepID=UPI0021C0E617|nr:LytTR family DNA-binding domain-containing protein [Microbacterium festucae]MCT9819265.1 LytTR family DNA-binding domain-containing protein [Microbacterium festucae]
MRGDGRMPLIDVLVADDERPALDELVHLLRADERVGRVHAASSGADALRVLSAHPVAIAFLDIHMPRVTGLDLARTLGGLVTPPAIVFVTADDAHAVDAFDLRAADYLLKPVRAERLRRAIDRALELSGAAGDEAAGDEVLPVTVGASVRFVRRADVRWVQAQGDYSRLHTDDGVGHLVRVPISELEQRWADAGWVRVHRSYLVDTAAVTEVRLSGAEPAVSVGAVSLPVSRRLVPAVREALLPGEQRGAR